MVAQQPPDGRWGGAAWNHGLNFTMHTLMLLRDLGLDTENDPARQAIKLVREGISQLLATS